MSLAFTLLWRQWRGRNLRLMLISLVLAMATLLSLLLLTERLHNSISRSVKELIAADARLESSLPLDADVQTRLAGLAERTSQVVEFQSMIYLRNGEEGQIAQVKAVQAGYPFYGHVLDTAAKPLGGQPQVGQVWINQRLAQRLNCQVGDFVEIGETQLQITAVFSSEPDNPQAAFALSSRLIMHFDDVASTQSIGPGARVNYAYLLLLKPDTLPEVQKTLEPMLNAHTRLVTPVNYRSTSQEFIERINTYLILAAALGILLSGIALAIAARQYTSELHKSFAVLKTFGMGPRVIARLFIRFGAVFFLVACVLALVLGGASHSALVFSLKSELANTAVNPLKPITISIFAGFILLLAFVWLPVWQLWRSPPAASLRTLRLTSDNHYAPGFVAIFLLIGVITQAWALSLALAIGCALLVIIAAFASLPLINSVASWGARVSRLAAPGFLSLVRHRRENRFLLAVFALLLVPIIILSQARGRLLDAWQLQLPSNAANYFLFNIYAQDKPPIEQWLRQQQLAPSPFYPMWRARITAINDAPLAAELQNDRSIGREINLTYAANLPAGNELVQGRWFDSAQQDILLLSIEERVAQMLNIQMGDRVTLSLAGEQRVAQVVNTRSVRWDNLSPNFYLITNKPPQSEDAANWITSLYVPESRRLELINHLKVYPNVTAIDVAQTIGTLRQLLNRLSQAVQLVWVLMLVAGLLVLLASVQASLPARRKEVALLRVAGASRNYITAAVVGEFFFLGFMAAIAALVCSEGILIWLQVNVFKLQVHSAFLPWILVPPSVGFLLACLGGLYCRSLAFIAPASILREQS